MNAMRRMVGGAGLLAVLLSATWAFAGGTMQKAPSGTMQKAPTGTGPGPAAAPPVKIEAQSLTVTPAQPKAGDQVTVKLTMKNTGTGTVAKVPWSIHLYTGNQTLAQGDAANLAPGASVDVTAQWTAKAGEQRLQGYVDPKGNVLKNTAPVAAQVKELTVNVPQAAAKADSTPAAKQTRVLEHVKAKMSGANFSAAADGPTTCSFRNTGGVDGDPGGWGATLDGVVVGLNCKSVLLGGGRANFELYGNFRLKNGWKIVRVETLNVQRDSKADFRWDSSLPSAGSDNPYMKIHLWADAGGAVKLTLKVTIEGPQGTDPYQ